MNIERLINFITFNHIIKRIKAAFALSIATVRELTAATRFNTMSIDALRNEQRVLREKLDMLVEHSTFQMRVKRAELTRAGHRVYPTS